MIRVSFTADVEPTDSDLIGYLESQRAVLGEIFQEVHEEIEPLALDELQTEPRKRNYPADYPSGQLPFVSLKQQRWYWANIGKPYKRTGKLAQAWRMYVQEVADGGFTMKIENPSKAAKYVYGSLAQDRNQAIRFQQPFHAATGWQQATDTVQFWLDAIDERVREKLDERLGSFAHPVTRKRAFTQGYRK